MHEREDKHVGYGSVPTGLPKHRFHFSSAEGERETSEYIWKGKGQQQSTPNYVDLDEVPTTGGRFVFFKNSLQHKVVRLYNNSHSEPAVRKIVLFWLIHPDLPIKSTQDVPPQQGKMTKTEAEDHRKNLMRERSNLHRAKNGQFDKQITHSYQFNFCEH